MAIPRKDKKLALLISSIAILIWLAYLVSSSTLAIIAADKTNINNLTVQADSTTNHKWLNSSRNITYGDLENRIILVDFGTYSCASCLNLTQTIKNLETQFGKKLTVIGVYSNNSQDEKDESDIQKAIIKQDINHLVINDSNSFVWNKFNISATPALVLIDAKGKVIKKYQDKVSYKEISDDIKKVIKNYNNILNYNKLPIFLEKDKIAQNVLKFPSGIEFAKNFFYNNIPKTSSLIIANTGKNTIIVTSLNGNTLLEIGSEKSGSKDGEIVSASFNFPRGLLFKDNILYVADTGNNLLRKIDFTTNKVMTIAGTGKSGSIIKDKNNATQTNLSSPWDLEFFPDNKHIIISNAGTNQLLQYDIAKNTIEPFAGDGKLDLVDGAYPNNSLAQPRGLSASYGNLYFVDPKTSSLRVANKKGAVKTIIGKSFFDYGHKNGTKEEALMRLPIGISADDTGVYIVDTHNHLIRKFDFRTKTLSDYSGDLKGSQIGNKTQTSYNTPEAIVASLNKFYIADTNNNRIIELNRNSGQSKLLDIIPIIKLPKEGLSEYLPNLATIPFKEVVNDSKINLIFNLDKGWKINHLAPSFLNLVEVNNKEANLIASFNYETINSGTVSLPELSTKYVYYLQGIFYYCEDKKNALCLVKSYEQKLIPTVNGSSTIEIKFVY
jgi:thiol-disulfide isomerase/thioredoxin